MLHCFIIENQLLERFTILVVKIGKVIRKLDCSLKTIFTMPSHTRCIKIPIALPVKYNNPTYLSNHRFTVYCMFKWISSYSLKKIHIYSTNILKSLYKKESANTLYISSNLIIKYYVINQVIIAFSYYSTVVTIKSRDGHRRVQDEFCILRTLI